MQATAAPALLMIFILMGTICGCTYGLDDVSKTVPDQFPEEKDITELHAISLPEAEESFVEFSKEYLHRDPTGSIRKIIGGKVETDGRAAYWIFGAISNNESEYFEVNSQGVVPLIWELPLPDDAIDTKRIVDTMDAIKATGDVDGERTVTLAEGQITVTTKTEDELIFSVIDAYTGEVVI